MKSFLVFILCFLLLKAESFDEKRLAVLETVNQYLSIDERPFDPTMEKYISKSTEYDIKLYVNTLNIKEISNPHIPENIFNLLNALQLTSKPIGIQKKSYEVGYPAYYKEMYGAVSNFQDMMFYYLFDIEIQIFYVNGIEQSKTEECQDTPYGKDCKTIISNVPKGVPVEDRPKIEQYFRAKALEMIRLEYEGIQQLQGKVLYTINQDINEFTEYFSGSSAGLLLSNGNFYVGTKCDLAAVHWGQNCNIEDRPKMQKIGTSRTEPYNRGKLTLFLTDDGNMSVLALESLNANKNHIIWSKKVFDPTGGELPFKFTITDDNDFITFDSNFKILGTLKNKNNFAEIDFALPDKVFLFNKNYTYFYTGGAIQKSAMYKIKNFELHGMFEELVWYFNFKLKKVYSNINLDMTGYTVIYKNGTIQHIQFEKEKIVDWEVRTNSPENGPYRLITTDKGEIQVVNSKGYAFWSSSAWNNFKKYI